MIDLIVSGLVTVAITLLFFLALIAIVAVAMAVGGACNLARDAIQRPRVRRELVRVILEHHAAKREIDDIALRARRQVRNIGATDQLDVRAQEIKRW